MDWEREDEFDDELAPGAQYVTTERPWDATGADAVVVRTTPEMVFFELLDGRMRGMTYGQLATSGWQSYDPMIHG